MWPVLVDLSWIHSSIPLPHSSILRARQKIERGIFCDDAFDWPVVSPQSMKFASGNTSFNVDYSGFTIGRGCDYGPFIRVWHELDGEYIGPMSRCYVCSELELIGRGLGEVFVKPHVGIIRARRKELSRGRPARIESGNQNCSICLSPSLPKLIDHGKTKLTLKHSRNLCAHLVR